MKKYWMFGLVSLILLCATSIVLADDEVNRYIKDPNIANLTAEQQALLGNIEHSGIQIIKQGMIFAFIIPTDCFFEKDTRALKRGRQRVLFELAHFLRSYSEYFAHSKIMVSGFTDKVWFYPKRKQLSIHYAKTIASQLKFAGLSSRGMKVRGYGAKMPIASNDYPDGTVFNRRVVVVIR